MQESLISFAYGLLTALILSIVQKIFICLLSHIRDKNNYSINGFYLSKYKSAFDSKIVAHDLIYISCFKNKISIKFQQYYNKSNRVRIFNGCGYLGNNSRMAIAYQFNNRTTIQNGTMLLTQIDLKATKKAYSGKFYEFDTRTNKKNGQNIIGSNLNIFTVDYLVIPANISLKKRFKYLLNVKSFKSYNEIHNLFEELYKGND